jgi:hypothetical protein
MSELVSNMPDCLVLKLEEVDRSTREIDTTLYILYDKVRHLYVIRGRRRWTPLMRSCTYSFECETAIDLAHFIEYVICKNNRLNETLFNYDNLSYDSNEITYEFLHDYDHSDYEISGYDNKKLRRSSIIRNLRMLRNVYNYY